MNFGEAIEAVKNGKRAARAGWNGKKMFVFLEPGKAPASTQVVEKNGVDLINGVKAEHFITSPEGSTVEMPVWCLNAADGSRVLGWVGSQVDMAAEDWELV